MGMETQKNKNARFGLAVDFIGAGMKGLVLYSVLLLTGFWGYQDGHGRFLPWFYLLAILFMILLAYIYHRWDGWQCAVLHLVSLSAWIALSWLVKANRWAFIAVGIVAIAESMIYKFLWGDTDTRRHVKRFKLQVYIQWGVLIWVCSMLLYTQSNVPSEDFPISPAVCGHWMNAAFVAYLILVVMFKYMFQQYDYFRQRTGVDNNTFRQLERMNSIVAVVVTILIALAMFAATETLIMIFSKVFVLAAGTAIYEFFNALMGIGRKELFKGDIAVPDSGAGAAEVVNNIIPPSEARMRLFFGIGLVVLISAALYLLWKLYKNHAANYRIGEDEAEYIPKHEEKELVIQSGTEERLNFANDNRGKIRKTYYKTMNSRMDKAKMEIIRGRTPKELASMYESPMENGRLKKMTSIYEKARYSDADCVDADVEKVRELAEK